MDFFRFWKKPVTQPVLPISVKDVEGGFVEVSSQTETFVMVSTKDTEDDIENPRPPILTEQETMAMAAVVSVPVFAERVENKATQNLRKERWERQYHKVFATVTNEQGEVFEVRRVNQNRQLAFWDCHHNTQIYVYPSKRDDQLVTKEKSVLTITR